MRFELLLSEQDLKQRRRVISLHLMLAFLLCGIGAGFRILPYFTSMTEEFTTAFSPYKSFGVLSLFVGIAIAIITVFFRGIIMKAKGSLVLRVLEFLFISGSAFWFFKVGQSTPGIIFSIIAVLIALIIAWEGFGNAGNKAIISEQGIAIPRGNFLKNIPWYDIESVLLRHGILTVEMPGNRLLQREFRNANGDLLEIENYCASEIAKNEQRRIAMNSW